MADWNSIPFGHGLFSQLVLSPILFQGPLSDKEICAYQLVADQLVTIGMKIQQPGDFSGTNEDFGAQMRREIENAEYGFSVLHETSDVLHETNYRSALQTFDASLMHNKTFGFDGSAVVITFDTVLHVAKQFLNTPLQLRITLRLPQSHGIPLSSRLGMNAAEKNIRLLMDLNRYRPQATPERHIEVPILVTYPLVVESEVREVLSNLSIVAITVRNTSQHVHIGVHELAIHFDRTHADAVHRGHPGASQIMASNLASLFSITLMNGACTSNTVTDANQSETKIGITIAPLEEYVLLYAVTPNGTVSAAAQNDVSSFVYHAPGTIYWSIADPQRIKNVSNVTVIGESGTESSDSIERSGRSELACSLSWTLGSTFAVPATCTSATSSLSDEAGFAAVLDITIRGPSTVIVDETFELSVCIRNNSSSVVENAVLCAPSRNKAEVPGGLCYVVHESETTLGDIGAGAAIAAVLRVTAVQLGRLCISDICVREASSSLIKDRKYQLKYPFQLLVQERLQTVAL